MPIDKDSHDDDGGGGRRRGSDKVLNTQAVQDRVTSRETETQACSEYASRVDFLTQISCSYVRKFISSKLLRLDKDLTC